MLGNDRYVLNIPADDPRFDELRSYLNAIQRRGKHSPVPRILSEWTLLGYLLTTGRLATGLAAPLILPESTLAPDAILAEMAAIAQGTNQFDLD